MEYLFNPGLSSGTANDKVGAYTNMRNMGYTDAQLRAAADAQFGKQSDADWQYLQGSSAANIKPSGLSPNMPGSQSSGNPKAYDQANPYLSGMASTITSQVNDNLNRNILPGISSGAQMVGGYGGSRQGVVEANALKDANQSLSNSLTGMYYGDYNNAMNRQLQQYGIDKSYNLGLGNLALGNRNADNSYNLGMGQLQLGNRNTDLNQVQLGANLFNMGNQGYTGQGQGVYNLGLTQQQAPWQTVNNMNSNVSPYTGYGTTTATQNGSLAGNVLGGALAGAQFYKMF